VLNNVVIPTLVSPVVGVVAGYLVMLSIQWIFRRGAPGTLTRRFRIAQIFSATFMAYAHGAQDSQKTVGVIALVLVVSGTTTQFTVPLWVNLAVATVVAAGTYSGGARIIRTMGRRIVKLEPAQGFAAETTSATVLLINSLLGFTISTTHVITSSIMGVGAVRRLSAVRWGLASNIVIAWILTIPASALVAGIIYGVGRALVL
jgi:PiT family inorganic phosphate transporter